MTTMEIMQALPSELTLWGEFYTLRWQPTTHYKYVTISYENERAEVLEIDELWFYVETEKHYAAYVVIQMILNNADIVLSHLWHRNQRTYNEYIKELCTKRNQLQEYYNSELGIATYDKKDMVTVY